MIWGSGTEAFRPLLCLFYAVLELCSFDVSSVCLLQTCFRLEAVFLRRKFCMSVADTLSLGVPRSGT